MSSPKSTPRLESDDFDTYVEMDQRFHDAMTLDIQHTPEVEDGTARLVDFTVRRGSPIEGTLEILLQLDADTYGVYITPFNAFDDCVLIETLDAKPLETIVGTTLEYTTGCQHHRYKLTDPINGRVRVVNTIRRFESQTDSLRISMADTFTDIYNADIDRFTTAPITDYTVTETESGIQQDIAVKLWFELPTGQVKTLDVIHDATNPSPTLTTILNHVGIDPTTISLDGNSLFTLHNATVPVVFDDDWKLHFGRTPPWFYTYLPYSIDISRTAAFGKTYGHDKTTEDTIV